MSLVDELRAVGFSARTANALVFGYGLRSIADLKADPWPDDNLGRGMEAQLLMAPNMGQRALKEVLAFRSTGNATPDVYGSDISVSARLTPGQARALDDWIARQADRPSRSEAARRLIAEALGI